MIAKRHKHLELLQVIRTILQLGRKGLAWYPQNSVFPNLFHQFVPLFLWVISYLGQAQSYYVYRVSSVGGYLDPQTTSNSCGVSDLAFLPKAFHVNLGSSEKKYYVSGELTFDQGIFIFLNSWVIFLTNILNVEC